MIYSRWVSPNDGVCLGNIGADEAGLGLLGNGRLMTPWLGNNSGGRKAGGPASKYISEANFQKKFNDVITVCWSVCPALPAQLRGGAARECPPISFQGFSHRHILAILPYALQWSVLFD